MTGELAEVAMILLGVTSAVALVVWGLLAFTGSTGADPIFWVFAAAFLVYVGWDTRRHVRVIRSRSPPPEKRGR